MTLLQKLIARISLTLDKIILGKDRLEKKMLDASRHTCIQIGNKFHVIDKHRHNRRVATFDTKSEAMQLIARLELAIMEMEDRETSITQ